MNSECLKCGVETNYDGDLHCRKIFISEIKRLLSLNEFEKAKTLYFSELFDEAWKDEVLSKIGGDFDKLIREELRKKDAEQRHKKYLSSLGVRYLGTSPVSAVR